MSAEDWEAWCDATAAVDDEPPGSGWDDEEADDPDLAPGERVQWSAGFGKGEDADGLPGGSELGFLADAAAGPDDRYAGATDGELDGAIAAWDRIEAHASARKHLAIAEFIRRRPEQGCEPAEPGGMPQRWDEFAVDELRVLLAESKAAAEKLLDRALALAQRLPGTMAVSRSGKLRQSKVTIIVDATAPLDDDEAQAAEEQVLGRASQLTPSGLRDAIARAVMEVAPEKAKKRKEDAAKDARVERWAEDSGNAALMGRELPPAEVLAADQRITAWAHELRKGGLDGDMDVLRARAYLDLLLGKDSRPSPGDGPAQVQLHSRRQGWAAGRAGDLAAADPRTGTGPDRGALLAKYRGLRPPVPGQGPQSRSQAPAPGPGPARHLRQPGLPPARHPVRLRAQHPVRGGRADVPL
ncbi:MAG TPA: DUF222 domain-containing protein [Streptosporangiaceae bacterium]|nr:DUF222 domain-containing protein [Streptosporangiaceae bacterium]